MYVRSHPEVMIDAVVLSVMNRREVEGITDWPKTYAYQRTQVVKEIGRIRERWLTFLDALKWR